MNVSTRVLALLLILSAVPRAAHSDDSKNCLSKPGSRPSAGLVKNKDGSVNQTLSILAAAGAGAGVAGVGYAVGHTRIDDVEVVNTGEYVVQDDGTLDPIVQYNVTPGSPPPPVSGKGLGESLAIGAAAGVVTQLLLDVFKRDQVSINGVPASITASQQAAAGLMTSAESGYVSDDALSVAFPNTQIPKGQIVYLIKSGTDSGELCKGGFPSQEAVVQYVISHANTPESDRPGVIASTSKEGLILPGQPRVTTTEVASTNSGG